jgi:hypothetical protein
MDSESCSHHPGLSLVKGDLAAPYHHALYFGAVDLGLGA